MRMSTGMRRTLAVAAVAAAVAAMPAACGEGEASDAAAPPSAAAPSVAPASAAASATPATGGTTRAIPSSIPDAAFLQAGDVPGKAKEKPRRLGPGDQELPEFCDADYDQGAAVGIRATQSVFFAGPDDPAESTPKAAVYEDVLVFQGDAATTFMSDLRAAVQGCAVQKEESGVTVKNYLRGEIGAGDESVLIERTRPATDDAGEPVGGGALHHLYWTATRVGDSVAVVSNTGWESVSAERADTVHLGGKAAARLAAWRG
ncbi:hypothetical protein ACIA5D_15190 [Actinoplanes sp. NPDC051513]|uniref:hypothetical protein n=1 Tax=Actinoplanes sp. NPDC051513 TaxID=3363908 RepID=UPI003788E7CD